MIVTIVTFRLPKPLTLAEATATFQSTAPNYQGLTGLVRKNYLLSEDGTRAGGIYDWKKMVEAKYGSPPVVEYLHSPVMVDNRDGSISVAA